MTFDTTKLSETDQAWIKEQPAGEGEADTGALDEFMATDLGKSLKDLKLSLIHISEPTRRTIPSRMPSSA